MFDTHVIFSNMEHHVRYSPPSCHASPPIECLTPCIKCFDVLHSYEDFVNHMKTVHPLFCCDRCNFWNGNQLLVRRHMRYCRHFVILDENTQW